MLQILLAILYISVVCHSWGFLAVSFTQKLTGDYSPVPFPLTCITGLAIIGMLSQAVSIFLPMGGWMIQLFLLLPLFYLLTSKNPEFNTEWQSIISNFRSLHTGAWLFLASGMVFIVIVGVWTITNPDTIGYHAPLITWNQEFKVTRGIANINGRLGLQSSWFILCALFNFSFTGTNALSFVNSTLLCWLVIFMAVMLSDIIRNESKTGTASVLWSTVCLVCFGVTVQVYLAASSANPDFVICIFAWAGFYLLLKTTAAGNSNTNSITALILLAFAVTLKLSVIPALVILPLIFMKLNGIRFFNRLLLMGGILAVAILPFLFRNYIVSGYILYPAMFFDLFQPDWKADPVMVRQIDEYVSVYAKVGYVTIGNYTAAGDFPFSSWFPFWLAQYTWGEKLLCFAGGLAILANCLLAREFLQKKNQAPAWIFLTCTIGCIVLMAKAPSPRFAQAFLLPPILIAIYLVLEKWPALSPGIWIRRMAFVVLLVAISGYSGFRFYRYFDPENLWKVNGINRTALQTINCNGVNINLPVDPLGCGNAKLPCANNPCITFMPRGKSIADGFRPAEQTARTYP